MTGLAAIRALAVSVGLVFLSACSQKLDAVSQQMASQGGVWMTRQALTQPFLLPGSDVAAARDRLVRLGFEEVDQVSPAYLLNMEAAPSEQALVFTKRDSDSACRMIRHVIIEPADGRIAEAYGATGEAGCL